ncbi:AAA family ATPase [Salsuginibacillus kocurii]|uniref:AAA family ATPase n=1 Tax=Salsuginibacillus kocurii TaxID=427078 RepID=UPI0003666F19|nr:AAA family ATPase [Salsuginibacillus kocurii]
MATREEAVSHTTEKPAGTTIAICSATGGNGRTMITVNLSSLLAERGYKVTAVDGDLQFGDISLALDLQPSYTIKDAVNNQGSESILNFCSEHESGLRLLAAPTRPEEADLVTEEHLDSILSSLQSENDYVVIDTTAGLNDRSLPVLEKADYILVVTTGSMAALKNANLMLQILDTLELKSRASVIVNRSTAEGNLSAEDLIDLLKIERLYYLPEDRKNVSYAFNTGRVLTTILPNLEVSKAIIAMVDQLFLERQEGHQRESNRFLQNVMSRMKNVRRSSS